MSNRVSALAQVLLAVVFLGTCALPLPAAADPARGVVVATVDGTINPATVLYIESALDHARQINAEAVILKLNTPGGLVDSMKKIVEGILDSPVPVVVYVAPSGGGAISAGMFITLAGHVAAMAPGTNIGAAHPVSGSGTDLDGDMRAKIENYAVSLAKSLADQRGRNAKWAELAVRESVAITEREALQERVVDLVATDVDQLLGDLAGRTVTVQGAPVSFPDLRAAPRVEHAMTLKQRIVDTLSDPSVAYILGLVGFAALAIEFLSPGVIAPGLVGAICLILAATSFSLIPINTGGVILLLFGGALLIAEMFVPSFGALGIAGIVSLVLGGLYFVDPEEVFSAAHFGIHWSVIASVIGSVSIVLFGLGYAIVSARKRPDPTGLEGLYGRTGTVTVNFRSGDDGETSVGRIFVNGELWQARLSAAAPEPPVVGEKVVVEGSAPGMTLIVRRA